MCGKLWIFISSYKWLWMCWKWFSMATLWIIPSKGAHSEASVAWRCCCQMCVCAFSCVTLCVLYVYCVNCAKAWGVSCGSKWVPRGAWSSVSACVCVRMCVCERLCYGCAEVRSKCHFLIWWNCLFPSSVFECVSCIKRRAYERWMSVFDAKLPTVKLQLQSAS